MKVNNLVKGLTVLVIVLSIGLISTTAKLISTEKTLGNQKSSNNVDKIVGEIPPKVEEPENEDQIIEEDEPVQEDSTSNEDELVEKDNNNNKNKDKDKKDNNKNQNNNKDKDKDKDKDNDKNKNKNKKDKDKEEKMVQSKYISKEKAIEIGLKKVGSGAKLIKVKFDLDDNPPKYELEVETDNYEYELEIHAITGAVIDFEKDDK